MIRARRGEVWQIDFGIAAKVRPALLLTAGHLLKERGFGSIALHSVLICSKSCCFRSIAISRLTLPERTPV